MGPRSPSFRAAAAAVTALQLLGAALWPIVDARLEAAERVATAHVESERSTPCTPGHDDFFCHVCRAMSVTGGQATSSVPLAARTVRTVAVSARESVVPPRARYSPNTPRPPPAS